MAARGLAGLVAVATTLLSAGCDASGAPASPREASASAEMTMTSRAGTVVVRCADAKATVMSSTPHAGYRAEAIVTGPAAEASLAFTSDSGDAADVKVALRCVDGLPTLAEFVQDGS